MQAIMRPRNKSLGPGRNRLRLIWVIFDGAMVSFGHEHHRPVDWLVRS
jgi:hypothetical protein